MINLFRNDFDVEDDGFVGIWFSSGCLTLISVIACCVVFFAGFENHLYYLWALGPLPFLIANGILFSSTDFRLSEKEHVELYRTQKRLPQEVIEKVGFMSEDEINQLSGDEALGISQKLDNLHSAYNERQAILRLPKVRDKMLNIDSAIESYKETNKSMRELV